MTIGSVKSGNIVVTEIRQNSCEILLLDEQLFSSDIYPAVKIRILEKQLCAL
jgi:hypothetical protein